MGPVKQGNVFDSNILIYHINLVEQLCPTAPTRPSRTEKSHVRLTRNYIKHDI